jgi:hypothetical protein
MAVETAPCDPILEGETEIRTELSAKSQVLFAEKMIISRSEIPEFINVKLVADD